MQGLKGEGINDIEVIWVVRSACVPCSHWTFTAASHWTDTGDIHAQTGFTETGWKRLMNGINKICF